MALQTDPLTRLHRFRLQALNPDTIYTLYANHTNFWGKRSDCLLFPSDVTPLCVPNLLRISFLPSEQP